MRFHHLTCASLVLGLAVAPAAYAGHVNVPGYTHVKSLDGIDEYRLDANGLTVLLMPEHAAPVVTYMVTYHVGSRNEVNGTTGGTHLLEHLMYKGSKKYDKKNGNGIDTYLERAGADYNASTGYDRTNYYATLGPDFLKDYIAIEADRMRNLLLRESDRKDEMTVVRNEFERNQNSPWSALDTQVWATAYQAHAYHHPVIGWRSDIEHIPIQKLRAFYNTFYWPNNATVTVVGDIDPAQTLKWINSYYGKISKSPDAIPEVYTAEPEQQGPRRVVVRRAASAPALMLGFKAPNARDPDAAALTVLELVLEKGKSSRLSRALVDTSIATDVDGGFSMMHDNGLFTVGAMLAPGKDPAKAEEIVLREIEKIKNDGVEAAEVERALGPYRANQAYRRDGTDSSASALNEYIAMGDWTLFDSFLPALEKVTPADVQRVARKYLVKEKSTTGWFVPEAAE